ncbi:outer membrane protein [Aurantimonas marianensis]|uniref:Porin family protein n=1 Tax=Aurantimonas marianensis TaxID=2920428 RepID=A0A9X2KEC7_9HYPH|nr:outer membrane protein [Aurantimonas marianensis]MCP3054311.1 porin family protein [Aurantimonas marianensis]
MTITRTLIASVVVIGATIPAALAADLPPIYAEPIYQDVPELVPVEIGNGWYLRGDVSYDFDSDVSVEGGSRAEMKFENGYDLGAGVGYRFTDFFRTDVTARYSTFDVDFGPAAAYRYALSSDAESWELMANAYVDLGTFVGFTPYLGGGVGAMQVDYGISCTSGTLACAAIPGASYTDTKDWRFAYSLMAGVAYDVTQNVALDIGYRYLNVEAGDLFGLTAGGVDYALRDDGFDRHTIQAGIRYSLW